MKETQVVSVVGLGYVGLPLTLLASKKYTVHGIDIFNEKISALKNHTSYIDDVSDDEIAATSATFTTDFRIINSSSVVIVCVPTPVDEYKQPDLTPVKESIKSVCQNLREGTLIIVESTINPGVCDEVVIPLIESLTDYKVGIDVHLAHCPERINPGDKRWNVSNINRVVGSNSEEGLERAYSFYSSIVNATIKKMNTLKEAEAVKIVENSFRDINIAFVNELAMSFHTLGINLENVIEGAATKPFGFLPHHPSLGVGGHCIPVDPYYLIEYASTYGFQHRFLSLAREINEGMPQFTATLLRDAQDAQALNNSGVTVLGLSYKANVADLRESPSKKLIGTLKQTNQPIDIYDPLFPAQSTVPSLDEALRKNRSVVLATNHTEFLERLSPELLHECGVKIFVDGRNSFHEQKDTFREFGITYSGIGT